MFFSDFLKFELVNVNTLCGHSLLTLSALNILEWIIDTLCIFTSGDFGGFRVRSCIDTEVCSGIGFSRFCVVNVRPSFRFRNLLDSLLHQAWKKYVYINVNNIFWKKRIKQKSSQTSHNLLHGLLFCEGKEIFYFRMHLTHFIYGYMA